MIRSREDELEEQVQALETELEQERSSVGLYERIVYILVRRLGGSVLVTKEEAQEPPVLLRTLEAEGKVRFTALAKHGVN